jgi:hypothetical protein
VNRSSSAPGHGPAGEPATWAMTCSHAQSRTATTSGRAGRTSSRSAAARRSPLVEHVLQDGEGLDVLAPDLQRRSIVGGTAGSAPGWYCGSGHGRPPLRPGPLEVGVDGGVDLRASRVHRGEVRVEELDRTRGGQPQQRELAQQRVVVLARGEPEGGRHPLQEDGHGVGHGSSAAVAVSSAVSSHADGSAPRRGRSCADQREMQHHTTLPAGPRLATPWLSVTACDEPRGRVPSSRGRRRTVPPAARGVVTDLDADVDPVR